MCFNCFINKFVKPIVNDKVIHCSELIDKVYEYTGAGGNAHIVVDDWNLEDHSIESCLKYLEEDKEVSDGERKATYECLIALKGLNEDERYCAMGIHDGHINLETLKKGE